MVNRDALEDEYSQILEEIAVIKNEYPDANSDAQWIDKQDVITHPNRNNLPSEVRQKLEELEARRDILKKQIDLNI